MPDSKLFQFVSEALSERTALEPIEARGTVRIALKQAGLSAQDVSSDQMTVVLARVLPLELERRGIDDAALLCRELGARVMTMTPDTGTSETPETIFERLGKVE